MSNTESNFFVSHFTDEEFHKETVVDRWPLHLTVVPPFEIPENHRRLSQVTSLLGAIGRELGPIKLQYGNIRPGSIPLEIGNEALYGPDNDIQVVEIIDPSGKLKELHKQLVVSLGHIGCTFTDLNPQWSMDTTTALTPQQKAAKN
jgi:hypothetical protein